MRIYHRIDTNELVLIKRIGHWDHIGLDAKTSKYKPYDYEYYDEELDVYFIWNPLPISCYWNLKYVGSFK